MLKSSFFTPNDYMVKVRRGLDLVRAHPGIAVGVGVLVLASWAWTLVASALGGPWKVEGWGGWALVIALLALGYGGAAWAGLAVRRAVGDGAEVTWTAWKDLLSDWGGLTVQLVLLGSVAMLPLVVPAVAAGVSAGLAGAPADPQAVPAPALLSQGSTTILVSLLGAYFLWTYPALVFFPEVRTAEVRRWAWTLSVRTWPLAVGWGVLNLAALAWAPGSRGADLWSTFLVTLQMVFVTAQVYLLADASKRPGFGP